MFSEPSFSSVQTGLKFLQVTAIIVTSIKSMTKL